MPNPIVYPLVAWARKLRFPGLFALTAALFAASVLIPDPLPLVDELLLGFGALLFASLKQRRKDRAGELEKSD